MRGASLPDVAARANVSLATVSYVLNGGPRPVSDALREKVGAAIQDLGYERQAGARAAAARSPMGRSSPRPRTRSSPPRSSG
jgi:LacI family transcriptional regulator